MGEDALAQAYLDQLVAALTSRGLKVVGKLPALTVRNPAVAGQDPRGALLSPGLSQQILIRLDEGLGLTWCWVWPAQRPAERGVATLAPEVELMCPAADIERAARLIANVLSVRGACDG